MKIFVLFCLAVLANATTTIATNDAAVIYSPGNWNVTAGSAKTINAGAYFRTIVSGTSIVLTTDTSNAVSPFWQLWVSVDEAPFVKVTASAGSPNLSLATGLVDRKHALKVVVKAVATAPNTRWAANSNAMVTITGIVLDTGKAATAPVRRSKNVLIYGDSITEGNRNQTCLVSTPDTADILGNYAWTVANSMDAEVGIIGFGSSGYTVPGDGSVPNLQGSYNLVYTGISRSFTSPFIDLVIYAEGRNDISVDVTTAATTVFAAVLALSPTTKQLVLTPFDGTHASELTAAVSTVNSPKVQYQSTSGWWSTADSCDTVHPYDYASTMLIGPRTVVAANALLAAGSTGTTLSGLVKIH